MTAMITPNTNGRKRASLNEQINRLDSILDGLSEGLNDAVADAVKVGVSGAVKEAVQAVLTEVLTNPKIQAQLAANAAPQPNPAEVSPKPSEAKSQDVGWWSRARGYVAGLRDACGQLMERAANRVASGWQQAREKAAIVCAPLDVLSRLKVYILIALAFGALVGLAVWYAGPWLSAIAGGIGGFITAMAAQAGLWLRQTFAIDDD